MMNKYILSLVISFLVFGGVPEDSFAQASSGSPEINAYMSIETQVGSSTPCAYIYWYYTILPPSNEEWLNWSPVDGFYANLYMNGNVAGILESESNSSYWGKSGPIACNNSGTIQQFEQTLNNDNYTLEMSYIVVNSGDFPVYSNTIKIVNPYNAPIGSPVNSPVQFGPYGQSILVPFYKMSLTKDPVNIATGEDYFSSTDLSLEGRGPRLALSRKYRSFSTFSGMFGYGWRTDYDVNLSTDSNGDVIIYDAEGTGIYFMNNSGTYTASPGNYSTIVKNSDNTFTLTDKHGIVTHFDINGRLNTRTDRNGNVLSFVYNPSVPGGTYIQDASGRQIKLYFNSNGNISSAVDPAGKTFQYGYDTNGNLVSVTDPTGAVTNYTYNASHEIVQFTNANGHNTYYQYDSQGRCVVNYRDNNVNKITLSYQPGSNTTIVTDSLGHSSTYVFNSYGLMLSYTDALGAITKQTWDPLMNKMSFTNARTDLESNTATFVYDGEGNIALMTDLAGNPTKMTYTANFNLVSTKTDAWGQVTNFNYDNNGNLMSITDALDNTHSFIYDQFGDIITTIDSRGNTTNFIYDAFGHPIQSIDALGNKTVFTYE